MLQHNQIKDRRLQYMRTHQDAFDVEPTFILSLFEEAVIGIEGACGVEPMCHVEEDRLFAIDFQVSNEGLGDEGRTWPRAWTDAVKFLDKVESQVGIRLNRNFLDRFVAVHIGSHKILDNTIGIDLRPRHEDSCIKIYMHLDLDEDPEDLVRTAIQLDGGSYSAEILQVLFRSTIAIGFNLFLNGYSDIELWAGCAAERYEKDIEFKRGQYLKHYVHTFFSQKVRDIVKEAFFSTVSFSKATQAEPSLCFIYENVRDVLQYFSFNNLGNRVLNFCQSQDCVSYVGVDTKEYELGKQQLEKFSIVYNKRDMCQQDSILSFLSKRNLTAG
jgi:LynF/TruF/PatF family peptide O-prenyltransferase